MQEPLYFKGFLQTCILAKSSGSLSCKFRFIGEVRPSLSLRGCVCSRGNLKKQKALEMNERSPQSHSLLRDDMRYTIAVQQTDKSEFGSKKTEKILRLLYYFRV